jgi:hypothetical protein
MVYSLTEYSDSHALIHSLNAQSITLTDLLIERCHSHALIRWKPSDSRTYSFPERSISHSHALIHFLNPQSATLTHLLTERSVILTHLFAESAVTHALTRFLNAQSAPLTHLLISWTLNQPLSRTYSFPERSISHSRTLTHFLNAQSVTLTGLIDHWTPIHSLDSDSHSRSYRLNCSQMSGLSHDHLVPNHTSIVVSFDCVQPALQTASINGPNAADQTAHIAPTRRLSSNRFLHKPLTSFLRKR